MKDVLKHIAMFMASLMLMTSCYTYRQVPTYKKYDLQVDDKVKITAEGIEYNEGKVQSINDSIIVIRQGYEESEYSYNTIRIDKIDMLHVAEFNGTQKWKWTAIGISIAIVLFISLYFILDMDDFVKASI